MSYFQNTLPAFAWKELQQDRQCTYNVTLRRVRTTIIAMEKQYVLHILSVCF